MQKKCFSELVDHEHGRFTAGKPDDPARQNVPSADILIPPGLDIDRYVVSAMFVTEDRDDVNHDKPFFPRSSERKSDRRGIPVVATRRREDANPSKYVREYIVMATRKI